MNMPLIAQDKANHFIYGLVIFIIVSFVLGVTYGLAATAVIGAAKEIYDKVSGKGNPEILDFLFTFAGGAAGYICTLIVLV